MIRVAAYTGGKHVPSSRYRIRQYIEPLKQDEIFLHEFISRANSYPPVKKLIRPFWAVGNLLEHLVTAPLSYNYDITLLQREFFSSFFTLESLTKSPRILDVDDAIWLNDNGSYARRLAGCSQAVICGNNFLADHFIKWNKNVYVIPTAVDVEKYLLNHLDRKPVIVWCGSQSNFKYLYEIEEPLYIVLNMRKDIWLRIIADKPPLFKKLAGKKVEFIKWSPENEVKYFSDARVGIMPLQDTEWARGKCSFKMLTYMAAAIPVVVSAVGMNNEILQLGELGIGVHDETEWIEAIMLLMNDNHTADQMGENGRAVAEKFFSTSRVAEKIAQVIRGNA